MNKYDDSEKLDRIAASMSAVQHLLRGVPPDDAGAIQLFYSDEMTVDEIAILHNTTPECMRQFFDDFTLRVRGEVGPIMQSPTGVLSDTTIHDLIAAALAMDTPAVSTHLSGEILAKISGASVDRTTRVIRCPVSLKETTFFLGRVRYAAGDESSTVQNTSTSSDGFLVLKDRDREVTVHFTVTLINGERGQYAIDFRNLPDWAVPATLSFRGPDRSGQETRFRLQGDFQQRRFLFTIDTAEQEMAFIDRTELYVEIHCSERS